MAKRKVQYVCEACGAATIKWQGRCSGCNAWNTLVEEVEEAEVRPQRTSERVRSRGKPVPLPDVLASAQQEVRTATGIGEFDRVLGGGLVPGSAILVGGEPGIGKSTLLLQVAGMLAARKLKVLYCTGEESLGQIGMRARRLEVEGETLLVVPETRLESLTAHVEAIEPDLLIVDSIQTVATGELGASPGSVTQLREVTSALVGMAKSRDMPVILVGHVTKDGAIAGPKMLEHMVDTVLYFEGERAVPYRIVRAVKNRFGSTNEIGVFEMRHRGLVEVDNPSGMFLSERPRNAAGSVVVCTVEGSRPLMAEIQALVSPNSYGPPRVTAIGVETSRVLLMLNILERRSGLRVTGHDVFVNVAGGIKINEPAVDAALVAALASSKLDQPIPAGLALFGEVGLTGEVRAVGQALLRLAEIRNLGFERCVLAHSNAERLRRETELPEGLILHEARDVRDIIDALFVKE